ncbi:MAG TPA: flagellar biosynthesis anti-sigma factor FlgM [Thermoclostridium sp.]|nr:flagellar biosynthesis anti-sigma factor FlgM [Clostridiaceae bacterium]HOJ40819.1 flagellar biosynthesis anti-sigma factor FlgM [bacterium]HOQ75631.1 flagellar biosynthesis anti-sigma factor FlgM [Thermoclostridium sp.]HPU45936.1 flagellar biosynthesis anti-sigma factor FlgM [Thermoclostridium sp.]
MKIWGDIPKVTGVYGNAGKTEKLTKNQSVASRKDELTLSGSARDFSIVMKALRNVPDIRRDKVDAISQKMESGEYSVPAEDVAARIAEMMLKKI